MNLVQICKIHLGSWVYNNILYLKFNWNQLGTSIENTFFFLNNNSKFKLDFLITRIFKFQNSNCHVSVNIQLIEKIFFVKFSQYLLLSKAIIDSKVIFPTSKLKYSHLLILNFSPMLFLVNKKEFLQALTNV